MALPFALDQRQRCASPSWDHILRDGVLGDRTFRRFRADSPTHISFLVHSSIAPGDLPASVFSAWSAELPESREGSSAAGRCLYAHYSLNAAQGFSCAFG